MHASVVFGFIFPFQAKRLASGTSPKWPILCRVGLNQSTRLSSLLLSLRWSVAMR